MWTRLGILSLAFMLLFTAHLSSGQTTVSELFRHEKSEVEAMRMINEMIKVEGGTDVSSEYA